MTAKEIFKMEMDFRIALGKLIYNYERMTNGRIQNPIYFDRLLDGDGRQIVVTPQPVFDHTEVVIESYGNSNGENDIEFNEFKKRLNMAEESYDGS